MSLAALEPFPTAAVPVRAAARFAQRWVVSVVTNVADRDDTRDCA